MSVLQARDHPFKTRQAERPRVRLDPAHTKQHLCDKMCMATAQHYMDHPTSLTQLTQICNGWYSELALPETSCKTIPKNEGLIQNKLYAHVPLFCCSAAHAIPFTWGQAPASIKLAKLQPELNRRYICHTPNNSVVYRRRSSISFRGKHAANAAIQLVKQIFLVGCGLF